VLRAQPDDIPRQQVVGEHHVGADAEAGRQLAQSGVETQRENGQDPVLCHVVQVSADALRADDEVAVRQHDALRGSGAPRRIEDCGHIRVDAARRRTHDLARALGDLGPGEHAVSGFLVLTRRVAQHEDVAE
jgi:hypothetical protein